MRFITYPSQSKIENLVTFEIIINYDHEDCHILFSKRKHR